MRSPRFQSDRDACSFIAPDMLETGPLTPLEGKVLETNMRARPIAFAIEHGVRCRAVFWYPE